MTPAPPMIVDLERVPPVLGSISTLRILLELAASAEGLPIGEVSLRAGVRTPANSTGLADTLESHGLVTRERSSRDRRKILLRATQKGREIADSVRPQQ